MLHIFNIFKKKKKEPKYTINLTPEVWQNIPRLTKKQIAELLARLKLKEDEAEKWKKKYKELAGKLEPKEVKVLKEALRQKQEIVKKKEKRKIALIPFLVVDNELKPFNIRFLPYGGGIVSGKRGAYKYFAGWELEESENGLSKSVNFLVKIKPKDKKIGRITPSPSADLGILNLPYTVQKITTGVYEAPIDKKGTLIEKGEITEDVKQQIEYLKQKIAQLEQEKEQLQAYNYELGKKYEKLYVENNKLRNDLILANYRADMATVIQQDQTEKVKGMMRDYGTILTDAMDAQINEMLQRRLSWILAEGNRKLRTILEESYGKPIPDEVWEKVERRFNKMYDRVMSSLPKIPKEPSQPQKGEKK